MPDDYNYAVFDIAAHQPTMLAFPTVRHPGEVAADCPLEDLDGGATVAMKSLWAEGLAVIEFGSFT